jgi:hypothetical protein
VLRSLPCELEALTPQPVIVSAPAARKAKRSSSVQAEPLFSPRRAACHSERTEACLSQAGIPLLPPVRQDGPFRTQFPLPWPPTSRLVILSRLPGAGEAKNLFSPPVRALFHTERSEARCCRQACPPKAETCFSCVRYGSEDLHTNHALPAANRGQICPVKRLQMSK